jgi:hypothetical protein
MIPVTHATIRMEFDRLSCGLSQSEAWARSVASKTLVLLLAIRHCDEHTESLIVAALLFQTRLQDLGRVLGTALALYVKERTADGRQVVIDTL